MLEHFFEELNSAVDSNKPAFISTDSIVTYKKLLKNVNTACQYLLRYDIQSGLIVIILPHTITVCMTILACLKAKVTFASIDINTPKNEIKKILLQLKPKTIICDNLNWITDELNIPVIHSDVLFNSENNSAHFKTLYTDNDDAFVTLTSGSTGIVKGVVHTNYSLCEAITHVLTSLQLQESNRLLCTIAHPSNAFLRNMLACLIKNATFILGYSKDFKIVLQLIDEYAPSHVRFSIKDLISFSQQSIINHKNIKYIQRCDYSGDVVPRSVITKVNQLLTNGILITSYAMSECSTIAINTFTKNKAYQSLTGKIIDGIQYRIVNEQNIPLKVNEVGELRVKSSTMFKKYLHDELETKNAFDHDGWFKTGDYFSQRTDGYLIFHGRKKNIIIKDGKNINPEYIRQVINEWSDVADCAVISMQSSTTLQEPIAFCSLKEVNLNMTGFKNYLRENLNSIWLPRNIYIVSYLPRTIFGKIDLAYIRNNTMQLIQQSTITINTVAS